MIPQNLVGTIPQWITASALIGLIGIVLRYRLGHRKLTLDDEADIRDHYAEEITALRAERAADAARHTAALEASDRRLAECERVSINHRGEVAALRVQVNTQHEEIIGLRRQIIRYSAEGAILLSEKTPSTEVEDSAHRVIDEIDKQDDK